MPDISQLTKAKPTEIGIDLGDGDVVLVTFDRNAITPAWVNAIEAASDRQDTFAVAVGLADVMLEWDVTKNGEPFPPTSENLGVLSYPAQAALLRRIMESAVPSRAEGNDSSKPSSTPPLASAAPSQTHPNGAVTSSSPEYSASLSPP